MVEFLQSPLGPSGVWQDAKPLQRSPPAHPLPSVWRLYLGETLKVCFLEAVLRDSRNGAVGDYPMDERELHVRRYAEIEIAAPLSLVDLRGDGAIRMGVPSDVARASRQRLGASLVSGFPSAPFRA